MITIDGTPYEMPIMEENRSADFLYKYADRTEDGVLHSQLIGVFFNYSGLKFGSITDQELYAAFWQKITEPVESHSVVMSDETGDYQFDAYFANISDAVKKIKAGIVYWTGLTMDIVAISPARVP
jgi:hypothetical protein